MAPNAWNRVRAVRLRALADSPKAFGTLLSEDEARPLPEWRARLENPNGATFLAHTEEDDIGIVTIIVHPEDHECGLLCSMWVAPAVRRSGLGAALIDAAVDWARGKRLARVVLGVGDYNRPAIALYEKMGFVPNGVLSTLPSPREHITEHERELRLKD